MNEKLEVMLRLTEAYMHSGQAIMFDDVSFKADALIKYSKSDNDSGDIISVDSVLYALESIESMAMDMGGKTGEEFKRNAKIIYDNISPESLPTYGIPS